jgi:hypothetical protein
MIAAPHCYAYDAVIAIPLLLGAVSPHTPRGILALIALSPLPYLLMAAGGTGPLGPAVVVAAVMVSAARYGLAPAPAPQLHESPVAVVA